MKKVVGIISCMPQRWGIRKERLVKLNVLIDKATRLFNLPVLVIAQNYKDEEYNQLLNYHDNVTILRYNQPLGITGAREELRKQFLATDYEVIILLDDDSEIQGNMGEEYLKQIEDHPGKTYELQLSLHKLMAFHRDAYKLQAYDLNCSPHLEPDKAVFEDQCYWWTFIAKYPELHYKFKGIDLKDISKPTLDRDSSWSKGKSHKDMSTMTSNTLKYIFAQTGMNKDQIAAKVNKLKDPQDAKIRR